MRTNIHLLSTMVFMLLHPLLSVADIGPSPSDSTKSKASLLSLFSSTLMSTDGQNSETIETFATGVFPQETLLHLRSKNESDLSDSLFAVELLLKCLTDKTVADSLDYLRLSKEMQLIIGIPADRHWVTFNEISHNLPLFEKMAQSDPTWGSIHPKRISEAGHLLDQCLIMQRIAGTFTIPNLSKSYEESYLDWISQQKLNLESFQNFLEGIEIEETPATREFSNAYQTLKHQITELRPLFIVRKPTVSGLVTWSPIQKSLLTSLDTLFVPVEIIDWALFLDAVTAQKWELANDRLVAMGQHAPQDISPRTDSPVSFVNRHSFYNGVAFILYSISLLSVTLLSILYMGGIGRAYRYALISALVALSLKLSGAVGSSIFSSLEAGTHCYAFALVCLIGSCRIYGSRSWTGVCLILLSGFVILSPDLPLLKTHIPEPFIPTLLLFTLLKGVTLSTLMWTIPVWVIWTKNRKTTNPIAYRQINQIAYPFLLFSFVILTMSVPIIWWHQTNFYEARGAYLGTLSIMAAIFAQNCRYLILRWTNQLSKTKAALLAGGLCFLHLTLVLVLEINHPSTLDYTKPGVPVSTTSYLTISATLFSLLFILMSYVVDHFSFPRILQKQKRSRT